jgi:hypothetical protein
MTLRDHNNINKDKITKRFLRHNFHDALLKEIHIQPAKDQKDKSSVEVFLEDYETNDLIQIIFEQPGNISFVADFDILRDNAGFGNTHSTNVVTDSAHILRTINSQKSKWNVTYPKGGIRSPIEKKINNVEKYITFKIYFFGGVLEVVAKNCKIKRTKNQERWSQKFGEKEEIIKRFIF